MDGQERESVTAPPDASMTRLADSPPTVYLVARVYVPLAPLKPFYKKLASH